MRSTKNNCAREIRCKSKCRGTGLVEVQEEANKCSAELQQRNMNLMKGTTLSKLMVWVKQERQMELYRAPNTTRTK